MGPLCDRSYRIFMHYFTMSLFKFSSHFGGWWNPCCYWILNPTFVCEHSWDPSLFNPLNAELNPIRHLLALVGARHFVHVSRIRVKGQKWEEKHHHKKKAVFNFNSSTYYQNNCSYEPRLSQKYPPALRFISEAPNNQPLITLISFRAP